MKLYEIAEKYRNIEVDEATGEVIGLDQLDDELQVKAEAIGCLIKELKAYTKAIKDEEDALKARRKAAENKIESLSAYTMQCMQMAGQDKIKAPKCTLSLREYSHVDVYDMDLLPDDYLRFKAPEPNKTAIKEKLEQGYEIPGASIAQTTKLQIR